MSKSTKRRRLLEETANLLENCPEISPITSSLNVCVSNVSDVFPDVSNPVSNTNNNIINKISSNKEIIDNLEQFTMDNSNYCEYRDDNRSETFENFKQLDVKRELSKWAVEYDVPNSTLSGLLKVLKKT